MGELTSDLAPHASAESSGIGNLSREQIGRYRLQQRLGSGGVATVYQAFDQVEGHTVALKVLLPNADENAYERFRREASTAGALRHPHIVRILQVGRATAGEVAYIAMELVDGESLAALLGRCRQLNPEESCNLLEPIARALAYAHRTNIIHRDVKPSNILLRPGSPGTPNSVQLESVDNPVVPLLSDFGIARALDEPELTSVGRTVGTPAYMAPEQCSGSRTTDGRTDIYALGTVLYRCITGRLPFVGTTTQILHAHVYDPIEIDTDLLSRLPPTVTEILQRTLAKEPNARYTDAEELANSLARAAGRPLSSNGHPAGVDSATATLTLSTLPVTAPTFGRRTAAILVAGTTPAVIKANTQLTRDASTAIQDGRPNRQLVLAAPTAMTWVERLERSPRVGIMLFWALAIFAIVFVSILTVDNLARLRQLLNTDAVADNSAGDNPLGAIDAQIPQSTPILATVTAPTTRPAALQPISTTWSAVPSATTALLQATATIVLVPTAISSLVPIAGQILQPTPTLDLADEDQGNSSPEPDNPELINPEEAARPIVMACPYPRDRVFAQLVDGMRKDRRPGFLCATDAAEQIEAEYLQFEHGFMVRLDDGSPLVYITYVSNEWQQLVTDWREGDPLVAAELPPPAPDLYQPTRYFGRVWERIQGQYKLGHAITAEAVPFTAIVQGFNGGLLIANVDSGQFYQFSRSDVILRRN